MREMSLHLTSHVSTGKNDTIGEVEILLFFPRRSLINQLNSISFRSRQYLSYFTILTSGCLSHDVANFFR